MNSTTGRGVKNWPKFTESGAKEFLQGQALDVVAGLGEIKPLQLLDDAAEGFLRKF